MASPLVTPLESLARARSVALVEGPSDQIAIEVLARRRGRVLEAEGVVVASMGGITNIARYLEATSGMRVAGLCDVGDVEVVRKAVIRHGLGNPTTVADLEELGFFVCTVDLEEELVRALGPDAVLRVFEEDGRLHKFRSFQRQPDKRELDLEYQLWDYLTNWKIHYAGLFVETLDLDRVPRPLNRLLDRL